MKRINRQIENPALGCKVGRAYQIMLSQLAKALEDAGLEITTNEYLILRAIYSNPGAQQCEIAELVGKDKASVCRCVAGLEKRGLISTETVSYKCLKVYPTAAAEDIKKKIMEVSGQRHQALLDLTSPEELETFIRVLEKIINTK